MQLARLVVLSCLLTACGPFGEREPRDATPRGDGEVADAGATDAPVGADADAEADVGMGAADAEPGAPDAQPAPDAVVAADAQPAPDAVVVPDAGPQPGDCTGAFVCDDFEGYAVGAPPAGPWTAATAGGAVAVDETRAYRGRRSVRFTTDGMANYRRAYIVLQGAPTFPLPGNVMWGRAMMWLTAAPNGSVHWTNIEGEGPVAGETYRSLTRYGGQHSKRLMANYDTRGVATDCWDHSTTVFPEGRWACFEWRFNGPANEQNLWLDGVAISDITVMGQGEGCIQHTLQDRWIAPQYDTLRLGWQHYQATFAHELWMDEVAVDDQRIGCP